ncbi:hypothetical protein [[Mycobacterium] burgundiense]|uniref:Two-component sensor histidine kinase n=1 Tax=[Mycobacterium] burgundiense TaxID=3064286 RepID=A0ABN9MU07_9MYCO|nr:hypothetical protein [Mycolicibacterium sp. MU0053]CAJ1495168.1 hypothetical protein MU0053_000293 [Mycolicibacterium sp. MU0053]
MAWLLAVSIPALLMMATFGLERLETAIDEPTADDDALAALIDRVASDSARARTDRTRVRVSAPSPILPINLDDEPDLPTRICQTLNPNPQFQPTRHVNRV